MIFQKALAWLIAQPIALQYFILLCQGLVVNGKPNLKLYWTTTFANVAVGHVIFPLPQLISGTFPEESRYEF